MIFFNEKEHKYTDELGREYISVTTLLNKLHPFESKKIARIISKNPNSVYYEWSIREILEHWESAAAEGQILHDACEKYILKNRIPQQEPLHSCIKQFSKLRFKGKVYSEYIIYSEKYLIAGTADIIEELDNIIWLWDIKTYKKFNHARHVKFSFQLEIYRRFIEELFQKKCKIGGVVLFENYVKLKEKTKLTLKKPLDVRKNVDELLANRLGEIS